MILFRIFFLSLVFYVLSGCAFVSIDSKMNIEPVSELVEAPVFLDAGNCPYYYKNVVDGGQSAVQALFEEVMSAYQFKQTRTREDASFLLAFSCEGSTKNERRDAQGNLTAPAINMLSLGLVPVSESFPRTMGLKIYDLRSGQEELIDENVQEAVTKNYFWWLLVAPATWVDMFLSDSGPYSDAISQSAEGLLSQAINDYAFE